MSVIWLIGGIVVGLAILGIIVWSAFVFIYLAIDQIKKGRKSPVDQALESMRIHRDYSR